MPPCVQDPKVVLITGATGDLGSALALAYAAPDTTLILTGRDPDRLERICARCRERGAATESRLVDVRDRERLQSWLREVTDRHAVDLLIVNAGITSNIGPRAEGESWEAIERVIDVNLTGALATADAVLPAMRRRRRGQIAFISSLSAFFGLPLTPAYCASKAALRGYAEAWRGWLDKEGVAVNLICPGFVETAMSSTFPGPTPFAMRPQRAAAIIRRRLARNHARISFPLPLSAGMLALSLLPTAAAVRLVARFGFARPGRGNS